MQKEKEKNKIALGPSHTHSHCKRRSSFENTFEKLYLGKNSVVQLCAQQTQLMQNAMNGKGSGTLKS